MMGDIQEKMMNYKQKMLNELLELKDIEYFDLSESEEKRVLELLLNMPFDNQSLLIFKNYYKHTFDEIKDILGIENPKGEYLYLNRVLSEILEREDQFISENSMTKVSYLLAEKVNEANGKEFDIESKSKKQEKRIVRFKYFCTKKATSFAIVFLLGTLVLFSVNAFADGKIFEWIVESFEKYSSFIISEENRVDKSHSDIEITYIPEGFELDNMVLSENLDMYYYRKDSEYLIVKFVYDKVDSLLNTENGEKETFDIDGNKIFSWKKEDKNYYIFNKDDIGCQVYGNIDKDELIKIYNGIFINQK